MFSSKNMHDDEEEKEDPQSQVRESDNRDENMAPENDSHISLQKISPKLGMKTILPPHQSKFETCFRKIEDHDAENTHEDIQRLSNSNRRTELQNFERSKTMIPPRHITATSMSDLPNTANFLKEEIKEEIKHSMEEEKELRISHRRNQSFTLTPSNPPNVEMEPNYNAEDDDESQKSETFQEPDPSSSSSSSSQPEEPRHEPSNSGLDLITVPNLAQRLPPEANTANSLHTRNEINSSVEVLSNTIPIMPVLNDFDSAESYVTENRNNFRENLEDQIDSIKVSFVDTITHENYSIHEAKKELNNRIKAFKKANKQEFDRIQMQKEICRENKKRITKLQKESEDIIDLDVGGTHHITTTRATL